MATAWTRTREQLRSMIGRKLGILGTGQTLSAEDAYVVDEGMDARLKELHSLGLLWWQVAGAATTVTLTAGQATASLSAITDFLFPVSLMLPVGTDQQPVEFIGHRQYHAIPNKTEQGEPEYAYINGSTMYLWPVPQTGYSASLTYQAIATDTATGVTPDVPVSMLRAFAVVVAADLTDDFGVPVGKQQALMAQQVMALRTIRALNAERVDGATVAPDWY